jgi:hypothetical protein
MRRTQISGATMLPDGLYELFYVPETEAGTAQDSMLVALRAGRVLGSDRWGGVFIGRCDFDPAAGVNIVHAQLMVPPGGTLATESQPRDGGSVIDIATVVDAALLATGSTIEVDGQRLRIALVFKGPVPA